MELTPELAQLSTLLSSIPVGGLVTLPYESCRTLASALTSTAQVVTQGSEKAPDRLLKAPEAAALLGLQVATLYKPRFRRQFAVKVGGRSLRFSESRILRAIDRGAIR